MSSATQIKASVRKNKNGEIENVKLIPLPVYDNIEDINSESDNPVIGLLQGRLVKLDPDGTIHEYVTTAATPSPEDQPSTPTVNGGGSNVTPPSQPAATAQFQKGVSVFQTTGLLADFNAPTATDPHQVGNTMVEEESGKLKFTFDLNDGEKVGVNKDLSGNLVRGFNFTINVDVNAEIDYGNTIAQFWLDGYTGDFIQIRLDPDEFLNDSYYHLVIHTADNEYDYSQLSDKCYVRLQKGVDYNLELVVTDKSIDLIDRSPTNNTNYKTMFSFQLKPNFKRLDNEMKYIGGVFLGRFYAKAMSGVMYLSDLEFTREYVYPDVTFNTELEELQEACRGWAERSVRVDGVIFKKDKINLPVYFSNRPSSISEGQSYGMVVAYVLEDQTLFDTIFTANRTKFCRLNSTDPAINTVAPDLMGWAYDPLREQVDDWNFATDADVYTAYMLYLAHDKWGSAGLHNYKAEADKIVAQLKQFNIRTITLNGEANIKVFTTDIFQQTKDPFEYNPSYSAPAMFRLFATETSDPVWDEVADDSYKVNEKVANDTFRGMEGVGLVPNFCALTTNGELRDVRQDESRIGKHGADAFRTHGLIEMDRRFNNSSLASAYLANNPAPFFLNEYNNKNNINAEYMYDGTIPINEDGSLVLYEKTMYNYTAYYSINQLDTAQAALLKTNKLDGLLNLHPAGSFYRDNSFKVGDYEGIYSYFGGWHPIFYKSIDLEIIKSA